MAEFSLSQKRQLFEQGWVVIPQVVPADMVRAARYAINSAITSHLDSIQVHTRELNTDERMTNMLMKTDAFSLIESALGKGKVVPSKNVQAALRFPEHDSKDEKVGVHIDGFYPPFEGQPVPPKPFIAIAGFFLNDVDQDDAGNFMVWPGTHRQFAEYFAKHGADPNLKYGIPPVDLPPPVQIKVKAGDMILAHYQLGHTASTNLSQAIRYAVYIRMHHADRPKDSLDVLTDIWKYWYGMSDVTSKD
jgi:hypothetical protein